ncbi:MAG: ABC transporter permease [Segetibacter sp.]
MFHYKWLAGSPAVLSQPNITVLTQKMAEKYFGNWKEAIGGLLRLDNAATVKVAGILENIPANSDFPLGIVTSNETAKANASTYGYTNDWGNVTSNFQLYLLLPPHVFARGINMQLAQLDKIWYKNEKTSKKTSFLQPLRGYTF